MATTKRTVDVALATTGLDERGRERPAIDVLSCTTTMEVGIDIGSLSGVALRNMPQPQAQPITVVPEVVEEKRSKRSRRQGKLQAH